MFNQFDQKLCNYICEEFEKSGLPRELGKFIFDGIGQDIAESWSEARFMQWCDEMKLKFPQFTTRQLIDCHIKVNDLTAKFTTVFKAFNF